MFITVITSEYSRPTATQHSVTLPPLKKGNKKHMPKPFFDACTAWVENILADAIEFPSELTGGIVDWMAAAIGGDYLILPEELNGGYQYVLVMGGKTKPIGSKISVQQQFSCSLIGADEPEDEEEEESEDSWLDEYEEEEEEDYVDEDDDLPPLPPKKPKAKPKPDKKLRSKKLPTKKKPK